MQTGTATLAKEMVVEEDAQTRLDHCRSLSVQGQTARHFQDRAAEVWAEVVMTLPDSTMRFALNAVTDTLPHNANLHLWGKRPSSTCQLCPERQTLHHVLNHCSTALEKRRYNQRHDDILASLYSFVSRHLHPGESVTVDLEDEEYCFPQDVAITDRRPDMVIWSDRSICLVELTIPFEAGMAEAAERKRAKYEELLGACAASQRTANLITIEVGSRGFINAPSLDELYRHLTPSRKLERKELEKQITRKCITRSHEVWCKRNWKSD